MSATISTETTINASPDTVWGVLTDFARFGEWNPFMDRAEGRAEVGEKLTIHMQPKGGRGMTFKPRVLVAEPSHELRWLGKLGPGGLFDGEHHSLSCRTAAPGSPRRSTSEESLSASWAAP
jgi:hypothetical protein